MDVALHRLPVTFVLDRAGITGPDGSSHHGVFDLSFLRAVPGLAIAARARPSVVVVKTREAISAPTFDALASRAETLAAADRAAEEARAVPARVERWFGESNFHHAEFGDLRRLVQLKEKQGVTVSLVLPTLNEEETIGPIVRRAMREMVERLVPAARHEQHPRLSRLSYAGASKLSRLPPRSAIVAFSIPELYRMAAQLRARGEVRRLLAQHALEPEHQRVADLPREGRLLQARVDLGHGVVERPPPGGSGGENEVGVFVRVEKGFPGPGFGAESGGTEAVSLRR